ncbi:unnamed protein product [Knipowitschia caucasica]|uniref:Peroxiredoxin like 2C n=1 Tax=Knipowitschia caucasica TaxID=637954 RepID=A0AAV2MQU7_KNICA
MAEVSPITKQITKENLDFRSAAIVDFSIEEVEDCLVYDKHGVAVPFQKLYQDKKSIIIFVRNFLCYSCKEYVEDLSKIPLDTLQEGNINLVVIGQSSPQHIEPFCSLTGYPYEIYVDPERCIYQKLGMKTEATFTKSGHSSPHVKSSVFTGQIKSIWRAVTSPAFDFQGNLHQQGGAMIVGPGSIVHFFHCDLNHLDHMPINWLLQLAGVQHTLDFSHRHKIIHV